MSEKLNAPIDVDALVERISATVLEKVTASLDRLIANIVSDAISKAVPVIARAVAAALDRGVLSTHAERGLAIRLRSGL